MTPRVEGNMASLVSILTEGLAERVLVIGPMVWQSSDGLTSRVDYFITAGKGVDGFRCEQIIADGQGRLALLMALTQVRPGLVVHVTEDELYMARLCETLWPCDKTRRIHASVKAERTAA